MEIAKIIGAILIGGIGLFFLASGLQSGRGFNWFGQFCPSGAILHSSRMDRDRRRSGGCGPLRVESALAQRIKLREPHQKIPNRNF
jgi:hypothetical protein